MFVMNKPNIQLLEKLYTPSILLTIFLGLVLRIRFFLTGRSLWLDEAMLALNILNRSFGGLFHQPMEYGQSSPIGYLISVKAITLFFGNSEYALRLYSLLAGSFALILMAIISKDVLGKSGSLLVLALLVFSPDLIYYSSETKQYISDVIATITLLFLFLRQIRIQSANRDFVFFSLAGAILVWFSHPIVFVTAGVGITLFLHYWRNNDRARMLATSIVGLIWGVSLVVLYFVNLRYLASSELLLNYWKDGFMELSLKWFVNTWQALLITPLDLIANPMIVFVLFIIGLVYLFRHNWQVGSVIILTLAFSLFASGLHKYPLVGRMLLFGIPIFAITISAGIVSMGSLFKRQYVAVAFQGLIAVYLLWAPLTNSFTGFVNPLLREHIKPTLEYLRDYKRDSDLIYVYYNTGPAFRYYAPKFRLDTSKYIIGSDPSIDPEAFYRELDDLAGEKRVWLIFSHVYEKDDFNEKDFILAYADQFGEKIREFRVPSTSIYLYLYGFQ